MATLKTNYKNYTWAGKKKFRLTNNADGTVSLEDVTAYTTQGDSFGATDANAFATKINEIDSRDYIVERGTNGSWSYEKWNGGWIELWGTVKYTGINATSQSAGTYYDGTSKRTTIPVIQNIVNVVGTNTSPQYSGVYLYNVENVNGATFDASFRAHSSASNASCGVKWHVVGWWK